LHCSALQLTHIKDPYVPFELKLHPKLGVHDLDTGNTAGVTAVKPLAADALYSRN